MAGPVVEPVIADVVVVGAGSAGCVLAARLAADGRRRVVLVEAGPDGSTAAVDGVDFFAALAEPGRTWPGLLVRRTTAQEPVEYRRGRGLGGSSAVNALVALPGVRADYAGWPWGADAISGWFAAARAGATPLRFVDASPEGFVPFEQALVGALEDRGLGRIDPWTSDGDGWFGATWTVRLEPDGRLRRWSAADAYVAPARERLTVVADTPAATVRLTGGTRATGVVLADGQHVDAGDVIVAAGAIHSPLLLAASGVERPALGHRLKDHAAVALFVQLKASSGATSGPRPHAALLARLSSGEVPGDLQLLLLLPGGSMPDAAGTAIVMVSLMHVASQGVVAHDGIEQRMLSDAGDRRRLRVGVRALVALLDDDRMRPHVDGAYCDDQGTPASHLATLDDDALDTWMLTHLGDYVHVAGSCAMGAGDDAVVDSECRVIGVEGLRVCDASVMPDLPRANTHLTTWALAELLAVRLAGASARDDGRHG